MNKCDTLSVFFLGLICAAVVSCSDNSKNPQIVATMLGLDTTKTVTLDAEDLGGGMDKTYTAVIAMDSCETVNSIIKSANLSPLKRGDAETVMNRFRAIFGERFGGLIGNSSSVYSAAPGPTSSFSVTLISRGSVCFVILEQF
jgi:hypothetical protein